LLFIPVAALLAGRWRLRVGADSVARRGDPPRKGGL